MKPFNKKFILEKLQRYNKLIKNQTCGKYKIEKSIKSKENINGYMYENQDNYDIEICELLLDDDRLMTLDAREIEGAYEAICRAKGRVGIVGLGLGYVANEIAKKDDVKEVIVYEISKEVVEMYIQNFGKNNKIKIINENALECKSDKFDFFWVDIYGYELNEKIVNDYVMFNKIHDIKEYSFWGMEHFLLSCSYEEIIWVYVPEEWMAMCKNIYKALNESGYIVKYQPIDSNVAGNLLSKFKVVLNEGM